MSDVRRVFSSRLDKIIAHDPLAAEDTWQDQNKITTIIMINFTIRILKLGSIIVNICYFLGLIWFILADLNIDYYIHLYGDYSDQELKGHNTENFLTYYELDEADNATRKTIVGLYFGFTTLSTVGFGDYAPRSNFERSIGAFILISGVAMFSFLMGNFIEILGKYKDFNAEFDDGDTLSKFFGVMKHFNGEISLSADFKDRIENHFDYKWNNDRNLAISEPADFALIEQLPE